MEEDDYLYWKVNSISCEGNDGWSIYRTPNDWEEYDVRNNIDTGGCGDDPAEIISVETAYNFNVDDVCHWLDEKIW